MKTKESFDKAVYERRDILITQDRLLCYSAGFKDGVEYAERWILVSEELPELQNEPYWVLVFDEELDAPLTMYIMTENDIRTIEHFYYKWRPLIHK